MSYEVLVDDNFHYMDEDERTSAGVFATADEALAHARGIVESSLQGLLKAGMTAEDLYAAYRSFGEDPFIRSADPSCQFSAWTYAKGRCEALCGPA